MALRISTLAERTRKTFPLHFCQRRTMANDPTIGLANPAAYCRDFVRKHDYESFLVSHFYPKGAQDGFLAVKAFSVELATVQDNVSNAMIGRMRMEFWRDAVKGMADDRPPKHPIALALYEVSRRANLPAYHLKRMIDARDAELHTPSHLTIDSLTSHAESTSSTVLYLLLSLLSVPSSALSHAASHVGAAQTICTLLRALPYYAKKGEMVVPAEITAKHGVKQEEVFRRGPEADGIEDAVFEFATLANDHLVTAREMLKEEGMGGLVPARAMPVFLSGVPVANYLGRLENANFNAFESRLLVRDWKLPWQIWRSYYKRQF